MPSADTGQAYDQASMIEWLSTPEAWGGAGVRRIDTQISAVFLVGDRVFKLKRAVVLPFLDFSGLSARRSACEAEIAVNRRTAPDLYLGIRSLTADGWFAGDGPIVDWLVEMRRFEGDDLFDKMAEDGRLTDDLLEATAAEIAQFHATADRRPDMWRPGRLTALIDQIEASFPADPPPQLDRETIHSVMGRIRELADGFAPLIETRRRAGFVREVHGDLHLRNIVLWRSRPTLFDAIEFDEEIRCGDCLYDIAFLLMDLGFRNLKGGANRTFNTYLAASRDLTGLALMPLFLGLRAAIRSHVEFGTAIQLAAQGDEPAPGFAHANRYLDLARKAMEVEKPMAVAIGGLSGTGKSTVAKRLAPDLGPLPGAVILRSDEIRKELAGVALTQRLGPDFYTAGWSERVYGELMERADRVLRAGRHVIADAVFGAPEHRAAIAGIAADGGAAFSGIWLEVPREVAIRRVSDRRGDVSDADASVAAAQHASPPTDPGWRMIAATGTPAETALAVRAAL